MPKELDVIEMENHANEKDFVLKKVAQKGALLEFASEELKKLY